MLCEYVNTRGQLCLESRTPVYEVVPVQEPGTAEPRWVTEERGVFLGMTIIISPRTTGSTLAAAPQVVTQKKERPYYRRGRW